MKFVSLFAGIGGIDLGLERAGFQCVGQVEIDPYCQKVLAKHWPYVPRTSDVRDFHGTEFGEFDMLTGGYPCQPFSVAGKRLGEDDERHLWPEVLRIIRNVRPRLVLLENVAGHLALGFGRVQGDLAESGYDAEWDCIPAAAVGAPHRRDRVFIVAYPASEQRYGRDHHSGECLEPRQVPEPRDGCGQADVAHTKGDPGWFRYRNSAADGGQWALEPAVGRVADGVPAELDFVRGVIGEKGNYSQAEPEAQELVWRVMREVWQHRELAASSPDLYRERLHHLVPGVPRERAQCGWLLGKRIEEDEELRDLWERVHAQPFEEAHHLLPGLLERIGQKKRPQALGSHVDRLKALGNAVVPQVAEFIGRRILEATA